MTALQPLRLRGDREPPRAGVVDAAQGQNKLLSLVGQIVREFSWVEADDILPSLVQLQLAWSEAPPR